MQPPLAVTHRGPAAPSGRGATLVLLHGHGTYEDHLLAFAGRFDPRFRVVAARAPVRIGPGAYRWFAYAVEAGGAVVIDGREERRAFDALIDLLERERSRPGAVMLLGHSQGGMMALSAVLARPELVDGCAVLNARLLDEALGRAAPNEQVRRVPVYVAHGRADAKIPIVKASAMRERLASIGCPLDGRDHDAAHDVTDAMIDGAAAWLGRRLTSLDGASP